ncbi:PTS sugar transporter subunit IIA [Enterococcus sp. AZ103]|uniref:PTS sugar transporter subunit IIA n=1 Tax=Enterococcus sp. AZ103 TaxID=2774628 RepID=UPI003F1F4635
MSHVFNLKNIELNQKLSSKEEAIKTCGAILVNNGYVKPEYIQSMLAREEVLSTYMGNGIAIPHGVDGSQEYIMHSGISLLQVPEGVSFGPNKEVKVLIGIAGKNDEHLEYLSKIATVLSESENIEKLAQAQTKEEIFNLFEGVF